MSLSVASLWVDRWQRRVCVVGDCWPPCNESAFHREQRLLSSALERWLGEAGEAGRRCVFVGEEEEEEEEATAAEESAPQVAAAPAATKRAPGSRRRLCTQALRRVARAAADGGGGGDAVCELRAVASAPLSHLVSFMLQTLAFWQARAERGEASEEAHAAVAAAFVAECPGAAVSWRALFACVDAARAAAARAVHSPQLAAVPVAAEWFAKRLEQLDAFEPPARAFCAEFGRGTAVPATTEATKEEEEEKEKASVALTSGDGTGAFSSAYFRAVETLQEAALQRWSAWAENLGNCARDLLFAAAVADALGPPVVADAAAARPVVALVEHNVGISLLEFLASAGFQSVWFAGGTERVPPGVPLAAPALEQRQRAALLEQLATSFHPDRHHQDGTRSVCSLSRDSSRARRRRCVCVVCSGRVRGVRVRRAAASLCALQARQL